MRPASEVLETIWRPGSMTFLPSSPPGRLPTPRLRAMPSSRRFHYLDAFASEGPMDWTRANCNRLGPASQSHTETSMYTCTMH